jgi:hypothetical protein
MLKKSIKPGARVLFAQTYLPTSPYHKYFNLTGTVTSVLNNNRVFVKFDVEEDDLRTLVQAEDLELLPIQPGKTTETELADEPVADESLDKLVQLNDTELGGMSKAQLVALKLQAQESDPELDNNINNLLTE